MELIAVQRPVVPKRPFRTARGEKRSQDNVFVRLVDDGVVGYGESAPLAIYGEDAADVCARLDNLAPHLIAHSVSSVQEIEHFWANCWPLLQPSRAAQCALDLAMWDVVGKKLHLTASQLANRKRPRELESFGTIGVCEPNEIPAHLERLAEFSMIKLKMGSGHDEEVLQMMRRLSTARLCVDANCSWGGKNVAALSAELAEMRVQFIEQPLPSSEDFRMKFLTLASSLPIMADESCVVMEDVARLKTSFSGINVKLSKCGGITPGVQMIQQAKQQKQITMVGCMLESSCGIAAGAVVAQQSDYADLDGAWLLQDDPFSGTRMVNGFLQVSEAPGLGVEPVEAIFPPL